LHVTTIDELRNIPFLASLDATTLSDVARQMQRCEYRPGEYILLEGVRLSCMAHDGREQVLAMLNVGDNFNAVSLFDERPNPTSARAMSHVQCLLLPRAALISLIAQHADLAFASLREMAGQLRELVVLVEDLAFRSVRERLARQLLKEASSGPAELTQQELAERTGTVREIAGRALRQLAQEGIVQLARGRVIVLNREGLLNIIDHDYDDVTKIVPNITDDM
jgi:CRP/FNR family cyclic AMP-dependent transcriptional regulator